VSWFSVQIEAKSNQNGSTDSGPGMYPTMIFDSNFSEAFHYYFGGQFNIPEYNTYAELQRKMFGNLG
jgi:hypothetical protein